MKSSSSLQFNQTSFMRHGPTGVGQSAIIEANKQKSRCACVSLCLVERDILTYHHYFMESSQWEYLYIIRTLFLRNPGPVTLSLCDYYGVLRGVRLVESQLISACFSLFSLTKYYLTIQNHPKPAQRLPAERPFILYPYLIRYFIRYYTYDFYC